MPEVPGSAQPSSNAHFQVDLGTTDPASPEAGFCEVIFPDFPVPAAGAAPSPPGPAAADGRRYLILRRGVTAALDLYAWWNDARHKRAPFHRTVKIHLMSADHSRLIVTWTFHGSRPVKLAYSPLNALDGSALIETIELDFDSMEMA